MYFVTFEENGKIRSGILMPDGKKIMPLVEAGRFAGIELPETLLELIEMEDPTLIAKLRATHDSFDEDVALPIDSLKILAPIPYPKRDILGVAKNYQAHIGEVKTPQGKDASKPMWFSKRPDSIIGPDAPVHSYPELSKEVDYEAEMAVIIGKTGINIPVDQAENYVFGYTCTNDIGARDEQVARGQFYYAKSFDSFCPLGPAVLTKSSLPYPPELDITLELNGEIMQWGNTRDLIHGVSELISDFSQGHTIHAGDVILTGTPSGVGCAKIPPVHLKAGDDMSVTVEHLGTLRNPVD